MHACSDRLQGLGKNDNLLITRNEGSENAVIVCDTLVIMIEMNHEITAYD